MPGRRMLSRRKVEGRWGEGRGICVFHYLDRDMSLFSCWGFFFFFFFMIEVVQNCVEKKINSPNEGL